MKLYRINHLLDCNMHNKVDHDELGNFFIARLNPKMAQNG